MVDKKTILEMNDLAEERVYVPVWGCEVTVREMTALERVQFEACLVEDDPLLRTKLVAFSAVNDNGERMFSEEDIPALAKKNYKAIRVLSDVAIRLSRVGQAELESAVVNFPDDQAGG